MEINLALKVNLDWEDMTQYEDVFGTRRVKGIPFYNLCCGDVLLATLMQSANEKNEVWYVVHAEFSPTPITAEVKERGDFVQMKRALEQDAVNWIKSLNISIVPTNN